MTKTYALITGGSSGIGLELAHQLAQRGYKLLLVSNQQERLQQLQLSLAQTYGIEVRTWYSDLARTSAAHELFDHCTQNGLQVEVLVNNAGFFFFGQIVDAEPQKAEEKLLLHVLTTSLLCTLFGKEMLKRRKGFILNNSSISAFKDFPGIGYYGASKAYIKSFTRSLRTELGFYGIRVTCLCPGATLTDLYDPNVINVELGRKLGIMMSARRVARAGVAGLFNNRAVVIPGTVTKVMLFLAWLTPQWIIRIIWKYSGFAEVKD